MSGVYDGLTVVELADRKNQWAGKLLADGGGRVIQVEPPGGGPGRWCGPFFDDKVDPDRCLDYWWYNTGKQSVALDIGRQPGQAKRAEFLGFAIERSLSKVKWTKLAESIYGAPSPALEFRWTPHWGHDAPPGRWT